MSEYTITIDAIPPASLRGNSRASWRAKAIEADNWGDIGLALGNQLVTANPPRTFPITGDLEIEIVATNPRLVDGDNMLIAYKPFIDALQRVRKRTSRKGIPIAGAGVIVDDNQIRRWIIETGKGVERSVITIREKGDGKE